MSVVAFKLDQPFRHRVIRVAMHDDTAWEDLTRRDAERLRDELTAALAPQPSSTYLLACRLHDEARALGGAA